MRMCSRFVVLVAIATILMAAPGGVVTRAGTATDGKAVVFGADDRSPVPDTTRLPYSAICKLRVEFPNGMIRVSTGTLVGPRTVLTVGHVIHNEAYGGVASRVEVYPGYVRGKMPFGRCFVTEYQALTAWPDPACVDYDFALLTLNRDVGNDAGWLDVTWRKFHSEFDGVSLILSGYPCDLESGGAQYRSEGCCLSADNRRICYGDPMDTCKGQSGSPVWTTGEDGSPRIVGVHQGGYGGVNWASRVSEKVALYVEAFREGGSPGSAGFRGQSEKLRMRRWNRDRLANGESRSHEFSVGEAGNSKPRRLKFRVTGGCAQVERPDGTTFLVCDRHLEPSPVNGTWRVLFTGTRQGSGRRVRLRVKPNGRVDD